MKVAVLFCSLSDSVLFTCLNLDSSDELSVASVTPGGAWDGVQKAANDKKGKGSSPDVKKGNPDVQTIEFNLKMEE